MNAEPSETALQKARLFLLFAQLDEAQKVEAREVLRRLSGTQSA